MTMYTGLARIARKTGYPVVEVPGWEKRTRPQQMSDIRTITCHHTANGGAKGDYPSYNTVLNGRGADLPGPLAQYGIGRSGTIYVFAAGSANHAGESRSVDYEKIHAIGIEAEAVGVPGTPGDWPQPQMDSYAKLCKALIEEFQLDVGDVKGHKETCFPIGRKSDPDFDMNDFRLRVAGVNFSTQEEDDDMAAPTIGEIRSLLRDELTRPETVKELAKQLFSADVVGAPDSELEANPDNPTWLMRSYLNKIYENTKPAPSAPSVKK